MLLFQPGVLLTPYILTLTILTLIGSYHCFKSKHYGLLIMIGLIHIVVSPAFSLSIGTLILGFGIIQVYMGFLNTKKRVKAM